MARDGKMIIGAVALFLAAAYIGYVYGSMEKQQAMDRRFQLLNFSVGATEVKANIRVLDLVRAKKYKDAENLLESFLDVRLASLAAYESFAGEHPDKDVFDALAMARLHRARYPAHAVDPKLEKAVGQALGISGKGM